MARYSSKRWIEGNWSEVWNSVCRMWKPDLSAANQVRLIFMPPKGRTATEPSGSRLQGQPQCSSWMQFLGCFLDEVLDGVLVAQPVAAADRVVEVQIKAVVGLDHAGRPAFGCAGVAAHGVDLRDQRDAQLRVGLGEGDRSTQTRASRTDDGHIGFHNFH